jgi:hypothetical protein
LRLEYLEENMRGPGAGSHVATSLLVRKTSLSDRDTRYIARAICEEMTSCLVSTALVTGALNIVVAEKDAKPIGHIFRYLPAEPAVTAALLRGYIAVDFDSSTIITLDVLLDRLRAAKGSVAKGTLFDAPWDDAAGQALADVAHLWRNICVLGIATLFRLEQSCKDYWSTERLRTLDRLVELLGRARDGERPYVGADGYPLIPHWADQRRYKRERVDLCARIRSEGETHSAVVADVSPEGLGLERIFGLRTGARVSIQLDDGREFDGVVSWTAGGRAGLRIGK